MKTILHYVSITCALILMSYNVSMSQETQPVSESQKDLQALNEKQQTPLTSCNNELYNLNGTTWHRDLGEKEYYLTSVIKDIEEFNKKISVYDPQTNRYRRTPLKKINLPITTTSKKILQDYCINVPDYMTASVNVLIPEKALAELSANDVHYQEIVRGSAAPAPKSNSDKPSSTIWSEGFEGSLDPYGSGSFNGTDCYWGDVSCKSHSGGKSLWCAQDGTYAPPECSYYIDDMDAYIQTNDVINVSGYTGVIFSFWIYYETDPSDSYTEYYYNTGSVWQNGDYYYGSSPGWVQQSLLLTGGITTFQWAFVFYSYYGYYLEGSYLDDMQITGDQTFLTVDPTNKSVAADAGTFDVTVTSNVSWTVSENSGWLSCSPTYGSNNGSFAINYSANTSTSPRSAEITVIGEDKTQTIQVTQLGVKHLSLTPETILVNENPGQSQINVSSNVSWIVSETCEWVQCSPASGSNDGAIVVTFGQNTSISSRDCIIYGIGEGLSSTVWLTQAGMPAFIATNPNEINVNSSQGSATADISSNISWTVAENCDWVNCTPSSGSNSGSFTIGYNENTTFSSRSCIITISGQGVSETITLTQEGIDAYLNVSPDNITLMYQPGSSGQFIISSNAHWIVTKKPGWIDLSANSGDGSYTLIIATNKQNFLPISVTDTITISVQGINKDVIVSQAPLVIEDLSLTTSILIYPNPAQNIMYIKSGSSLSGLMNINIYNNLGIVIRGFNTIYLNEKPYMINISDIPAGSYFVKIYNNEIFCSKKLIKTE